MKKNKKIELLGILSSIINNDAPPFISKNFSERSLDYIKKSKPNDFLNFSRPLNYVASIFFALVTAYILSNFNNQSETEIVENPINEEILIQKASEKNDCKFKENDESKCN